MDQNTFQNSKRFKHSEKHNIIGNINTNNNLYYRFDVRFTYRLEQNIDGIDENIEFAVITANKQISAGNIPPMFKVMISVSDYQYNCKNPKYNISSFIDETILFCEALYIGEDAEKDGLDKNTLYQIRWRITELYVEAINCFNERAEISIRDWDFDKGRIIGVE